MKITDIILTRGGACLALGKEGGEWFSLCGGDTAAGPFTTRANAEQALGILFLKID